MVHFATRRFDRPAHVFAIPRAPFEGGPVAAPAHPETRRALSEVTGWGLVDAFRLHHEGPGLYSWWDYRRLAFPRNLGLRIDHVFLSEPLARKCTGASIERNERKGKQPSDHAPVVVELEV